MSVDFVFTLTQAAVIAVALPILTALLAYLMIPRLRNKSGGKIRRYLSSLVSPPVLRRSEADSSETEQENASRTSWRDDKVRLYFYYLGMILFVVSFTISEFYEVMTDLMLPVNQGSTGEYRVAFNIVFENLFSAGWTGTLPWIGTVTYHETWEWIFFTAAYTDNPGFLSTVSLFITLLSLGAGFVYLIPLLVPRIRSSFAPSMFFFVTGMTISTKGASSCLAYALAMAFSGVQIEYLSLVASGSMISGLSSLIVVMLPIVIFMFGLFLVLGRRQWKSHYQDSRSGKWFMIYISLSFWLGIAVTLMMV